MCSTNRLTTAQPIRAAMSTMSPNTILLLDDDALDSVISKLDAPHEDALFFALACKRLRNAILRHWGSRAERQAAARRRATKAPTVLVASETKGEFLTGRGGGGWRRR